MSEAIISRRGSLTPTINAQPSIDYFTENSYYVAMPGNYRVIAVGGGGRGGMTTTNTYRSDTGLTYYWTSGGGGSGYMNDMSFTIESEETVPITIGEGLSGITSFGTYVSANGGGNGGNVIYNRFNSYRAAGNGGIGYNNGRAGMNGTANAPGGIGGWLYVSDETYVSNTGSMRLYYGDGGNGAGYGHGQSTLSGNSGYMIVFYTP